MNRFFLSDSPVVKSGPVVDYCLSKLYATSSGDEDSSNGLSIIQRSQTGFTGDRYPTISMECGDGEFGVNIHTVYSTKPNPISIRAWIFAAAVATTAYHLMPYMIRFGKWMPKTDIKRQLYTKLMDTFMKQPHIPTHVARTEFKKCIKPRTTGKQNMHTHPDSAAVRSSTTTLATQYALNMGLSPFMVQASSADVKKGLNYSRTWYWGKDCLVPGSSEEAGEQSLNTLVDVDYYMDMPYLLSDQKNPVLLYTFQPKTAAYVGKDYTFTFTNKDEVDYIVDGGSKYKHQVWSYQEDVIVCRWWFWATYYQVERMEADEHHDFIALIPIGSFTGIGALLSWFLEGTALTRYNTQHNGFTVIESQGNGLETSVCRSGEYAVATIPTSLLQTVQATARVTSVATGVSTVQSWLEEHGGRAQAPMVCDYVRHGLSVNIQRVYLPPTGLLKYQLLRTLDEFDNDAKALMSAFMKPLLLTGYVPALAKSTEVAAVLSRVVAPTVDARKLLLSSPTAIIQQYINEFIQLLIPEPDFQKGHPREISEVYERQNRPSQQMLLERAAGSAVPENATINTFLKAEPAQKVADPRVISTYNTKVKMEYSRLTYGLAAYVGEEEWYTFGKTPKTIAQAVANICSNAEKVYCADANKMDGHVHQLCRQLELAILLRWAAPEHHSIIHTLHSLQYNSQAYTTLRFAYFVEFVRGSGSPETALFNTILAKFIDYITRRRAMMEVQQAYGAKGMFGGDDSIVDGAGITEQNLVDGAAMIGQSYTVETYTRGQTGVNYLSRFYHETVWTGDETSTCDIKRQLAKLHISSNNMQTPGIEKLRRKLSGLVRTDRHTPIFDIILQAAVRTGMDLADSSSSESWWAQYETDENWPNRAVDDPSATLSTFLGEYDLEELQEFLQSSNLTQHSLLHMPHISPQQPYIHNPRFISVMEDEIKMPTPEKFIDVEVSSEYCKAYQIGTCERNPCKFLHLKKITTAPVTEVPKANCEAKEEKEREEKINEEQVKTTPRLQDSYCEQFQQDKCTKSDCNYLHMIRPAPKELVPCVPVLNLTEGNTHNLKPPITISKEAIEKKMRELETKPVDAPGNIKVLISTATTIDESAVPKLPHTPKSSIPISGKGPTKINKLLQ
jgi:hypothetical protein